MNKKEVLIGILILISLLLTNSVNALNITIPAVQQGPYQDGHVYWDGAVTYTTATADGWLQTGISGGNTYRAFIDFNTSLIPDSVTITNVTLQLSEAFAATPVTNITFLSNLSSSYTTDQSLFDDCIAGNKYIGADTSWQGAGAETANVSLGTLANDDLKNKLTNDSFSICIQANDETLAAEVAYFAEAPAANAAVLYVSYTISPTLSLNLLYPTTNIAINSSDFFNVTVNVSCSGGACGDVNVSLDPAVVGDVPVKIGFFAKVWKILKFIWDFPSAITGLAAGGLVNATIGATPFYTNMSNPANYTDFACLQTMGAGSSCVVYWLVNATETNGTYDFFAYANSTTSLSAVTAHFNVTINDINSPTITPIPEFDPDYVAPLVQQINGNITFSANVTDDTAVSNVWINISNSSSPDYSYPLSYIGNDTYTLTKITSIFGMGLRNFTIYANDSATNQVNTSLQNFTVADLIKPSIANISIIPTYPDYNAVVQINATIYDDYQLDQAWVQITQPDGVSTNYSMSNTSALFNLTYNTTQRGRHIVYLYANDSSNNIRNTENIPRYFYVPPVIFTDKNVYIQGQTMNITGLGFTISTNITLKINSSAGTLTEFNTTSDGSSNIQAYYSIPASQANGDYTLYAIDPGYTVTVFKEFKIDGIVETYEAGTIVIPGDDKQNPDAYDLDFLRMYGVVYDLLDSSVDVDWIITPECITLETINVDTLQTYDEYFCHGFWLVRDNSTYLNSIRGSVQIHNLTEQAVVPKSQIIELRRKPRVALLSGSHGQITSTLTRSLIPYTLLTEADITNNNVFNVTNYDILMIGDYDFSKAGAGVTDNISAFVNAGGDVHAEDLGALSLDTYTNFLGNLSEDGRYKGNIRIIKAADPITQTQLDEFSNSYGTVAVIDVAGAINTNFTVLLADDNCVSEPCTNVKLISMNIGKGFVTYSGGHIGSSQGSSELGRARNRILDNLIFYGVQVNDLTEPVTWNITPQNATDIDFGSPINISVFVTDNVEVDTVFANISWDSTSQIIYLTGPDINSKYIQEFTNTTEAGQYNIILTANDTRGNIETAETYFNVLPDAPPPPSSNGGGGSTTCKSLWSCTDWSECTSLSLKTRTCIDIKNCKIPTQTPAEIEKCEYIPPKEDDRPRDEACSGRWNCSDWGECINETQYRTCIDLGTLDPWKWKYCMTTAFEPETEMPCEMPRIEQPAQNCIIPWWAIGLLTIACLIFLCVIIWYNKKRLKKENLQRRINVSKFKALLLTIILGLSVFLYIHRCLNYPWLNVLLIAFDIFAIVVVYRTFERYKSRKAKIKHKKRKKKSK